MLETLRERVSGAVGAFTEAVVARPRAAAAFGAAMIALLAAPLAVEAVALRALDSRARALGLEVDVARASLGLGKITFRDLTVRSRELPSLTAKLAAVAVFPGATLRPRRVEVTGGSVELRGAAGALGDELTAWQRAHRGASAGSGASSGADLAVAGLDVTWRGPGDQLVAWGVRYERDADGAERLSADLARATHEGARAEARDPRLALVRRDGARLLSAASATRISVVYDLDGPPGPSGGARLPTRSPSTDPGETLGPRVRARLRDVAARLASLVPEGRRLEVAQVHFELRRAGQSLNVGPATVVVDRQADAVLTSLSSGQGEGRDPLRVEARLPLGDGPTDVSLTGGPLPLDALGVNEHDMGLTDVAESELDATGRARLSPDGRTLSVSGRARLSRLSLLQPRLARAPVKNLSVSLSGKAELALDGSSTTFDGVEVSLGKARVTVSGALARSEGHAAGKIHVEAPLAACGDVLDATPAALVPLLAGLRLEGTFTFSGDVAFDTRRPGDARVEFTGANDCRVTSVPPSLSIERFRRPWERTVKGENGLPTTIQSGPGTRSWVPYSEISPHMSTAVVICEDGRFFAHSGFDTKAIQSSIRDNLREGRFVRGASTVTMQLAKNLYLEREKTVSRKLQEAVLTLLLEQSLTKEQILELYLNVVEFAPGVYGIGPAAAHYFHSTARDLSLGQSLYLASILPNPRVQHFGRDGVVRPQWAEYLRKLMRIAHKIHRIDDRELEAGLEETVQLGVAAPASVFDALPSSLDARDGADGDDDAPDVARP